MLCKTVKKPFKSLHLSLQKSFSRSWGTSKSDGYGIRFRTCTEFIDYFTTLPKEETTKNVLLVRHGQSYGNLKDELYGNLNYKLTDRGHRQSEYIRKFFEGRLAEFDSVTTSNLIRAIQTANTVLGIDCELGGVREHEGEIFRVDEYPEEGFELFDAAVRRDPNFNERDFGGCEGLQPVGLTFDEHYDLFHW